MSRATTRSLKCPQTCWHVAVLTVVTGWCLVGGSHLRPGAGGEDKPSREETDDAEARRDAMLGEMRSRIEAIKVCRCADDSRDAVSLLEAPVLRYSDQPRNTLDATIWGWGGAGRPIVLAKIEGHRNPQGPRWLFCIVSLTDGLVEVELSDGHHWSSKKPGIVLEAMPGGPEPASNKAGRLRQMRELARRFSATLFVTPINTQEELRLLTQPIYRYDDAGTGLEDGAIFSLTTNGTNPGALVAIELQRTGESSPEWRYAPIGMTQGGLSVRLDDKEVWTKPYQLGPDEYEDWLWFWEREPKREPVPGPPPRIERPRSD